MPMHRYLLPMVPILLWLLGSCGSKYESTHPKLETISESVYASGTIKSLNQYQVFGTVNGVISDIRVQEGSLVKRNDILMTVRNEPSRLNAENARLAALRADIRANSDKLKESRIAIDLAHAQMEDDSLLLVRQRNLKSKGIGTQVEFERREMAYKNSVTNYQLARLNYAELQKDLTFASEQAKTNLQITQSLADEYFIRAGADGKVYKLLKEKGELANAANPVAIIGDARDFYVELNVDEYDIARIKPDQLVLISMDSYKGQVFEARVQSIEPLMNEQSRSFLVNATLITRPAELYPNLSVEANIIIRSSEKAITIPRSYLFDDSLVMVDGHKMQKVVVGIKDYQKAEILSGLKESDLIFKQIP